MPLASLSVVVAGVGVPLAIHLCFFCFFFFFPFVDTPMWDRNKSWCALGCPSFLLSLSGVVAAVGVSLATNLFFFNSSCCLYTHKGQ